MSGQIIENIALFSAAINAGKIISFWNLPHLSYSSPDPELADKVMYTTLVRMISPFNRLGSAMVDIFAHYQVLYFRQYGHEFTFSAHFPLKITLCNLFNFCIFTKQLLALFLPMQLET